MAVSRCAECFNVREADDGGFFNYNAVCCLCSGNFHHGNVPRFMNSGNGAEQEPPVTVSAAAAAITAGATMMFGPIIGALALVGSLLMLIFLALLGS